MKTPATRSLDFHDHRFEQGVEHMRRVRRLEAPALCEHGDAVRQTAHRFQHGYSVLQGVSTVASEQR